MCIHVCLSVAHTCGWLAIFPKLARMSGRVSLKEDAVVDEEYVEDRQEHVEQKIVQHVEHVSQDPEDQGENTHIQQHHQAEEPGRDLHGRNQPVNKHRQDCFQHSQPQSGQVVFPKQDVVREAGYG